MNLLLSIYLTQSLLSTQLFFKNSPTFAYAMAGNISIDTRAANEPKERLVRQMTKEEWKQKIQDYRAELITRYIDSYEDAVFIIADRWWPRAKFAGISKDKLHAAGRAGIIEAIQTHNTKMSDLDSHVYKIIEIKIRMLIKKAIKESA